MRRRPFLAATGLSAMAGCLGRENVPLLGDGTADGPTDGPFALRNITAESGLDYSHHSSGQLAIAAMTRAGVYVSDFDNDGRDDLLAMGGDRPVLYRNTGGTFEQSDALPDVAAGFDTALFFDYNNDGWEDLLLLGADRSPHLLENEHGAFREISVGFEDPLANPIGAAAGDATGDGWPDVFVIQNGDWNNRFPNGMESRNLADGADNGNPNRLYRGDGDHFREITDEAGITGDRWSLATSFVDLTGDRQPDIHVANDFNRDVIYRNAGDGTFERRELGATTNRNGMSSTVADFTGDGHLDVFVTNIWYPPALEAGTPGTLADRTEGNNLLVNQGDGTFEDEAESFGIDQGGWGWAAVAVDLDNDTMLDLIHTSQRMDFSDFRTQVSDEEIREVRDEYSFYRYPAAWRGTEGEFAAVDPTAIGFESVDGRGLVHLDIETDGQQDLIVANADGAFQVYENVGTTGTALQVDVRGSDKAPPLGARVTVETSETTLVDVRDSKTDFLSQSTRILHFGLGDNESATVKVTWPDGTERSFEEVETGQRIAVTVDGIEDQVPFDQAG